MIRCLVLAALVLALPACGPDDPVAPSREPAVRPGAFCSTPGATAQTSAVRTVVCATTATDSHDRWRTP